MQFRHSCGRTTARCRNCIVRSAPSGYPRQSTGNRGNRPATRRHPMMYAASRLFVATLAGVAVATLMSSPTTAQISGVKEKYNATAQNLSGGMAATGSGRVLITIDRWSTRGGAGQTHHDVHSKGSGQAAGRPGGQQIGRVDPLPEHPGVGPALRVRDGASRRRAPRRPRDRSPDQLSGSARQSHIHRLPLYVDPDSVRQGRHRRRQDVDGHQDYDDQGQEERGARELRA